MAGRPTLYSDDMDQKAQTYMRSCRTTNSIPFIEELALELDVCRDTLLQWSYEHAAFSCTMQKLRMLQELTLKKGALCKTLSGNVAIFLLKANHGLSDSEPDKTDPFIRRVRKDGSRDPLDDLIL